MDGPLYNDFQIFSFSFIDCRTDACNGGISLEATVNAQSLTSAGFGKYLCKYIEGNNSF